MRCGYAVKQDQKNYCQLVPVDRFNDLVRNPCSAVCGGRQVTFQSCYPPVPGKTNFSGCLAKTLWSFTLSLTQSWNTIKLHLFLMLVDMLWLSLAWLRGHNCRYIYYVMLVVSLIIYSCNRIKRVIWKRLKILTGNIQVTTKQGKDWPVKQLFPIITLIEQFRFAGVLKNFQ